MNAANMSRANARRGARNFAACLALAAGVFALDQAAKQIAVAQLAGAPPLEILPFFRLSLVFNRGAAFGFLGDAGGWQLHFLAGVAVLVSAVLAVWMWRARCDGALFVCALALLLGGALGNLTDRIIHQYVIDFIVLHYRGWYFPAFNLADSAITAGAGVLILDSLGWRGARAAV
ncbi:MAG: signal peptidase II [Gammaproteobacteria bacterium]